RISCAAIALFKYASSALLPLVVDPDDINDGHLESWTTSSPCSASATSARTCSSHGGTTARRLLIEL
uniref:Uncharacterized protein n=1 Tax=Aegilops tauschii subsp. strangulata TaxID=200361 RepID=A0A453G3C8_AEGTS